MSGLVLELAEDAPAAPAVDTRARRHADADPPAIHDRRAYYRHPSEDLTWIRAVKLQSGAPVALLDLSLGGARLHSPVPLGPNSIATLEILGSAIITAASFRVVRCEVGGLTASGIVYRGACEFIQPLELPNLAKPAAPTTVPDHLAQLDRALKQLVTRAATPDRDERLSADQIQRVLKALHARAARADADGIGEAAAGLLGVAVQSVECGRSLVTVVEVLESQLRRIVPQARLRIVGGPHRPAPGAHEILIGFPDPTATGPLVSIDLPRAPALTAAQSVVLKATSRVIMLLQRLEPATLVQAAPEVPAAASPRADVPSPAAVPAGPALDIPSPPAASATVAPAVAANEPDTLTVPLAWQMVVVRYTDGRTLKGYTHDFLASRPQFSLRSSPSLSDTDVLIVPVVRLKAVFFVRDFAGNPSYVERTDLPPAIPGRRIQVTLNDDEVIVGTTVNYSFDGQGFYVTPLDPNTNNIRVFVVATSVRQVRFPRP